MTGPKHTSNVARYELQRALSFVAVFSLSKSLDVDGEVIEEFVEPHQSIIDILLEAYPSLEPTITENPVVMIEDDLSRMGLLDNEAVVELVDITREFFNENPDALPMTLELAQEEHGK